MRETRMCMSFDLLEVGFVGRPPRNTRVPKEPKSPLAPRTQNLLRISYANLSVYFDVVAPAPTVKSVPTQKHTVVEASTEMQVDVSRVVVDVDSFGPHQRTVCLDCKQVLAHSAIKYSHRLICPAQEHRRNNQYSIF